MELPATRQQSAADVLLCTVMRAGNLRWPPVQCYCVALRSQSQRLDELCVQCFSAPSPTQFDQGQIVPLPSEMPYDIADEVWRLPL